MFILKVCKFHNFLLFVLVRSYLAATSRQNLETIVEAIRHLEGDHLFNDDASGSRKGQLVEVEIDTEGEAIGCSLVVTSAQDEVVHVLESGVHQ